MIDPATLQVVKKIIVCMTLLYVAFYLDSFSSINSDTMIDAAVCLGVYTCMHAFLSRLKKSEDAHFIKVTGKHLPN